MLRKKIFSLLEFEYDNDIQVCECDKVYAELRGEKAYVGGADKSSIARAYMLFAHEYKKNGGKDFKIEQDINFKERGIMLDCSRNGVMRVEKLKEYMDFMAAHGLNTLWLYMEDVYEIPEYKFFGYMRGRYTGDELKEIDDYAYEMGIEVVPCVQFLGHLEQYLRWKEAKEFRDNPNVLLIGDEKTYKFIEAAVKALRSNFRTKKIHIGMDEAFGVGLGNYLLKNGFQNRFEIMNSHLERILEICKANDFKPMMWSDMFFRLGSKNEDYYDPDWNIDEKIVANIPDVDMVYWDYYHDKKEDYLSMMQKHKKLGKHIVFAGGVWTWAGFLPNNDYTLRTMIPGLEACVEENIETVVMTEWQDDGCETNHFMALPGMAVISEYCFRGKDVTLDEIKEMCEFITGMDYKAVDAMSAFHEEGDGNKNYGKRYIWSDFLYTSLVGYSNEPEKTEAKYAKAYEYLQSLNGKYADMYEYAALVLKIAHDKCVHLRSIRNAYINRDRKQLENLCENILPNFKNDYEKLHKIHKKQWLGTYKPFGWETVEERYAMLEARAEYASGRIKAYLNGEINVIEELEEETLAVENKDLEWSFAGIAYTNCIHDLVV